MAAEEEARPEIERSEIEIDKMIGEGAFGTVFRGRCRGKDVAVKVFKKENVSKDALENFRDEVQIMTKISHPNILLFMGVCTSGDEVMVITPLMPMDLETLLIKKKAQNQLSLFQRLKLMRGAVLGVRWLHESNPVFIHRDLKLSNLLIDESYNVFVCDFGLTKVKPKGTESLEYDPHGSPLYMAPEVFIGDFNEKCDVYSFGICLWEALTQTQAFADKDLPSFIHSVVDLGERPPIPADCPESLRALITDCWQQDPEKRPTFAQINDRIDVCLIDSAINDEGGRVMWKNLHKTQHGLEEVNWTTFAKTISKTLNVRPDLDSPPFKCLKALTASASTKKIGNKEVVTLPTFGAFLDWFGPLQPTATSSENAMDRVLQTLRNYWFHGQLSLEEANARLAGQPMGTFLIRFSSQPGCFALSYTHPARPQNVHQRITYFASRGVYTLQTAPEVEYSSLKKLIRSKKDSWGLANPCPGSKYIPLFSEAPSEGVNNYEALSPAGLVAPPPASSGASSSSAPPISSSSSSSKHRKSSRHKSKTKDGSSSSSSSSSKKSSKSSSSSSGKSRSSRSSSKT